MTDIKPLIWLFFQWRGRVSRQAYFLAGMLLYLARLYPFYKLVQASGDEQLATYWAGIFVFVVAFAVYPHLALTVKRLHDLDRSGWWSLFFILGDAIVFIVLCLIPGNTGPNRFGGHTNAPS